MYAGYDKFQKPDRKSKNELEDLLKKEIAAAPIDRIKALVNTDGGTSL